MSATIDQVPSGVVTVGELGCDQSPVGVEVQLGFPRSRKHAEAVTLDRRPSE